MRESACPPSMPSHRECAPLHFLIEEAAQAADLIRHYRTSHINLFYENDYIFPFTLKLSFGEYLAGDKGFTFDVSRNFNNGVRMGAFFTRTDITKRAFGEGSFDKGIYFSIPLFGNEILNYSWRPLTKDPGAKLIRKNTLYQLLRKYKF